ncbi:MAG: amidohydrolase family protein [Chloroflexota bacterium]|nr:MAG: amidohydrolase [Chloroflexota bacterium]
MPDVPIVDAHVHLWDPRRFRMTWIDGNELLERPYGLAEYREHTQGLAITGMVYLQVDVEPAYGLLEARWVAELARQDPRIGAIVAYAPVEDGDVVRSYLEALTAIDPRIRGVRRLLQGESDPEYCLRPGFLRGVELLPEYDLSFDICIYHHQLPAAVELVRRCPGTRFMLDHIAKPGIRDGLLDPWRAHIREMAALPNVMCKVSGVVTEADHQRWTPEQLRPYIEHVLECFGEDRVCFGGDWPVVLMASSYRRWVETLDSLTAGLTEQAKRKLWAENARQFYRLP